MEEKQEHQQFHVGLKAFIADGKNLLVLQDTEGFWELPGGRIEKGEIYKDLKEILRREVAEELGLQVQYEIGPIFHAWIRKPDPATDVKLQYRDNDFCIFLIGFRCIYRSGELTLSPEHQNFRWITESGVEALDFENTYKDAIKQYFQSKW